MQLLTCFTFINWINNKYNNKHQKSLSLKLDEYPFGITNPSPYILESVEYYWMKLTQNVTYNLYSKTPRKGNGTAPIIRQTFKNF